MSLLQELAKKKKYLEEVVEVLEDPYPHLIQVLEEAIEDGHQVRSRQLVSKDQGQLVDGECQRPAHLPLREGGGERTGTCWNTSGSREPRRVPLEASPLI